MKGSSKVNGRDERDLASLNRSPQEAAIESKVELRAQLVRNTAIYTSLNQYD
jgi:hypothetical protein